MSVLLSEDLVNLLLRNGRIKLIAGDGRLDDGDLRRIVLALKLLLHDRKPCRIVLVDLVLLHVLLREDCSWTPQRALLRF